jgi:hypothetical protein
MQCRAAADASLDLIEHLIGLHPQHNRAGANRLSEALDRPVIRSGAQLRQGGADSCKGELALEIASVGQGLLQLSDVTHRSLLRDQLCQLALVPGGGSNLPGLCGKVARQVRVPCPPVRPPEAALLHHLAHLAMIKGVEACPIGLPLGEEALKIGIEPGP